MAWYYKVMMVFFIISLAHHLFIREAIIARVFYINGGEERFFHVTGTPECRGTGWMTLFFFLDVLRVISYIIFPIGFVHLLVYG